MLPPNTKEYVGPYVIEAEPEVIVIAGNKSTKRIPKDIHTPINLSNLDIKINLSILFIYNIISTMQSPFTYAFPFLNILSNL